MLSIVPLIEIWLKTKQYLQGLSQDPRKIASPATFKSDVVLGTGIIVDIYFLVSTWLYFTIIIL